jgi:excisionase family DNA binding protein
MTTTVTPQTPWCELPDLMTIKEVCAYTRLSRNTVYEMVRTGQIPSLRFAYHQIRIPRAALRERTVCGALQGEPVLSGSEVTS